MILLQKQNGHGSVMDQQSTNTGEPLFAVGTKFQKSFPPHGVFTGEVKSFRDGLYQILYSDGDTEELYEHELQQLISQQLNMFDANLAGSGEGSGDTTVNNNIQQPAPPPLVQRQPAGPTIVKTPSMSKARVSNTPRITQAYPTDAKFVKVR